MSEQNMSLENTHLQVFTETIPKYTIIGKTKNEWPGTYWLEEAKKETRSISEMDDRYNKNLYHIKDTMLKIEEINHQLDVENEKQSKDGKSKKKEELEKEKNKLQNKILELGTPGAIARALKYKEVVIVEEEKEKVVEDDDIEVVDLADVIEEKHEYENTILTKHFMNKIKSRYQNVKPYINRNLFINEEKLSLEEEKLLYKQKQEKKEEAVTKIELEILKNNITIHNAIDYKHVQYFLQHSVTPNLRDKHGKIPLHYIKHIDAIQLLLECGADPNAQDNKGNTPLHSQFNSEVAHLLLNQRANPNIENDDGNLPIHLEKDVRYVDMLLKHGSDLTYCNGKGKTPEEINSVLQTLLNSSTK
jgi:hypothetical protein